MTCMPGIHEIMSAKQMYGVTARTEVGFLYRLKCLLQDSLETEFSPNAHIFSRVVF